MGIESHLCYDGCMTIRKADSKGRISGFTPGGMYEVDIDADEVSVIRRGIDERSRAMSIPASDASLAYLRSYGLNPDIISRDNTNSRGYFEFLMGTDGSRIRVERGAPDSVWREWPTGFDYDKFVDMSRG